MRIVILSPTCLILIAMLGLTEAKGQEFDETMATGLTPVYPEKFKCGQITSLFGSWLDLDFTKRDEPHTGIDLGNLGDFVVAPADGIIKAIWRVEHEWGDDDWNILITHSPADLNLPRSSIIYHTEFDHLQKEDIAHLAVGKRLRLGDRIGLVRHPGNNAQFRAESHMEIYEVPANKEDELSWHTDIGFKYWYNPFAELIDPLFMMAQNQDKIVKGEVDIELFQRNGDYRNFRGFIYPLSCPED